MSEALVRDISDTALWVAHYHAQDTERPDAVRGGVDLVVNLAAGLDTRRYRMDRPRTLRWVEVDLPGILDD